MTNICGPCFKSRIERSLCDGCLTYFRASQQTAVDLCTCCARYMTVEGRCLGCPQSPVVIGNVMRRSSRFIESITLIFDGYTRSCDRDEFIDLWSIMDEIVGSLVVSKSLVYMSYKTTTGPLVFSAMVNWDTSTTTCHIDIYFKGAQALKFILRLRGDI